MADIFGFGFEETAKEMNENRSGNLTAGTYKMMVTEVEVGNHPFGGQFELLGNGQITDDLEIRIKCCLTADANGFKEGWKHTLFLSTMQKDKNDPSKLSVKANMDRQTLVMLGMACCGGKPKSEQELVNKQFYLTLKEKEGKDGKSYINVAKIQSIKEGAVNNEPKVETAAKELGVPNTAEPDWL